MRSTGRTGRARRRTRVRGFVGLCVACVVMPCLSWAQDMRCDCTAVRYYRPG